MVVSNSLGYIFDSPTESQQKVTLSTTVKAKAANFVMLANDFGGAYDNTGAGAGIAFNLPAATLVTGKSCTFHVVVAQSVTMTSPTANIWFQGRVYTSIGLTTQYQALRLISDGTNYFVTDTYGIQSAA
jgi:hypothetical protein